MEKIRIDNKKLAQICYILGSYDKEMTRIEYSSDCLYLILGDETRVLPFFILEEIKEIAGDEFCVCRLGTEFSLLFDRDLNETEFSIPVIPDNLD